MDNKEIHAVAYQIEDITATLKKLTNRRNELANVVKQKQQEWATAVSVLDGFDLAIEILKEERKHGPQT